MAEHVGQVALGQGDLITARSLAEKSVVLYIEHHLG